MGAWATQQLCAVTRKHMGTNSGAGKNGIELLLERFDLFFDLEGASELGGGYIG